MRSDERVLLLVRPKGAGPSWWPVKRTIDVDATIDPHGQEKWYETIGFVVDYAWVTITDGGGFTAGLDPAEAVEGDEAQGERIDAWFEAHEDDPWPWEIQAVRLRE